MWQQTKDGSNKMAPFVFVFCLSVMKVILTKISFLFEEKLY